MKKRVIIGSVIGLTAILIIWGIVASGKKEPVETITATIGDISRDVLVTGTTRPMQSVDLSFERTGKVNRVYAKVGDKVRVGQALVGLESGDLLAQLAQAKAGVASAQAQLDSLKRGTRPEEIAIQNVRVATAQVSLNQAQKTMIDALNDAFAKADDAARNKTDDIFNNPRSGNPTIGFIVTNPQLEIDSNIQKAAVESMLTSWSPEISILSTDSDLLAASAVGQNNLKQIKVFLDKVALMLGNSLPTPDISQTTIDGYKTNTSTARAAVALATTALATAETSLRSAQSTLTLEQNNLALKQAGSTDDAIAVQQALVNQAQAGVRIIEASLSKTVLYSPINGVVKVQDAKLGQIVTASISTPLISIISMNNFEIDANIPEVDIGRLALGQPVKITFDALPNEPFVGSVMKIDPAETIIDGVVNYQIKVALDSDDDRIKSGLTANLSIETSIKKDVVLLPQNTILQNDDGTFVRVPDAKGSKEVSVTLGIRGNNGMVEIVSGVSEGDIVEEVGLKTK